VHGEHGASNAREHVRRPSCFSSPNDQINEKKPKMLSKLTRYLVCVVTPEAQLWRAHRPRERSTPPGALYLDLSLTRFPV
jgi:hypothetical protein